MGTLRNVTGNNFLVQALQETKDYTQEEGNATEKKKPCDTVETETAVKNVPRSSRGANDTGAASDCGEETRTREARHNPRGSWLSKGLPLALNKGKRVQRGTYATYPHLMLAAEGA
ncbi:hypothetical protein NDU88_006099 [Pleurodeles waltl]|uniref:Uncharacterized protein n=1 Tax=Pleurodeles waltl TaxID=8319 RepID=A0AAV7PK44_PLEWA|nr:hypothetical protein NDU88_006099 [Pleurodeles waltl]